VLRLEKKMHQITAYIRAINSKIIVSQEEYINLHV
jgi:hypothetical protein